MVSYFIVQTGEIPGLDLIRALEYRGGISDGRYIGEGKDIIYYIEPNTNHIEITHSTDIFNESREDWNEVVYDKDNKSFVEKDIVLLPNQEYYVPSGYNLVEFSPGIYRLEKIRWKPKLGDTYWECGFSNNKYYPAARIWKGTDLAEKDYVLGSIFKTEETCSEVCAELNTTIINIFKKHLNDED